MADKTSTCTMELALPIPNKKAVLITSDATLATGDTIDMSAVAMGQFSAIDIVYVADATGVVKTATFVAATRVITLGTLTTGVHKLLVVGDT